MTATWTPGTRVRPTAAAWAPVRRITQGLPETPIPGRVVHGVGLVYVLHDDGELRPWFGREVEPVPVVEVSP